MPSERGESSGSSRLISDLDTTAWTTAESPKPSTSAQRISQNIENAKCSASTIAPGTDAMKIKALSRSCGHRDGSLHSLPVVVVDVTPVDERAGCVELVRESFGLQ